MDLMDLQPEFTKALWDYLDLLVNDAKIGSAAAKCSPNTRRLSRR
ncbi:MAG: hypothetical protein R3D52_05005 [Xanthobacteraceae bacterium]